MSIKFTHPSSTLYPTDAVCADIVRALELRNFDVPNVSVTFRVSGSGEAKIRTVKKIDGPNFSISFGRFFNLPEVESITIPKQRIELFEGSGPYFSCYVGNDWGSDKDKFGILSALDEDTGIPYILYRGRAPDPFRGEKYSPSLRIRENESFELLAEGHPVHLDTDSVLEVFRAYLKEVLDEIESLPVPERIDPWPEPDPIPVPDWLKTLYCHADRHDALRISRGKKECPDVFYGELEPSDRYGMHQGWRLVSLDFSEKSMPRIVHDGFIWCTLSVPGEDGLEVPGSYPSFDEKHVVKISLKDAAEVYVADHGVYEKRREEMMQEIKKSDPDRMRFTNAEVGDFTRARARTLVLATEYNGDYEQPLVLIRREVALDEVEILT